eukprot:541764-Rhodomonas_salina.1
MFQSTSCPAKAVTSVQDGAFGMSTAAECSAGCRQTIDAYSLKHGCCAATVSFAQHKWWAA